ncbi:hypothetical protein MCOR07_003032 [Pyricularia oryzae]|uniref:HEAT repeat protein n=3 Tax=Pyricularia TaxID=48558 RepID=A0ABQ8N447_PYRGI|nr:uncharacterized protein MGG_08863 [Pyricularia oryzae 70-15]KAH8837197.1 hypothetical protein MCOR01_010834 [Pyricularia oryzae]KAI6290955.1 hypothetical protein MCOR33_010941 [Pyricularia grisea]EHA54080.1 hypothetical protein MGG_08863 [Pyricularia oryzae 70-15]KAI6253395.1 hypothetical protein MCOR19_010057 [Pyricularia oryzae]KAI6278844.1 hypothetical protein MCOR26_004495 [Pyricularia oryzae]
MEQPLFRNSSSARTELFAKLKPCCVEISKLVMRPSAAPSQANQLLQLTDRLYSILNGQVSYDASAVDAKIAEYVFFPLSFVFKNKEDHSARVLENAIKCLRILIQYGWRSTISTSLTQQLLILLTFIIAGVPGQQRTSPPPEETVLECYRSLAVLIREACLSSSVSESLVDSSGLPSLGHTVTVILDGSTDGMTADIQLAALDALRTLFVSMKDRAALASFLPGSVSTLSKLLSPPASLKLQKRVLCYGARVFGDVLTRVLGDIHNRDALRQLTSDTTGEGKDGELSGTELSASWLKATSAQVRMALAMVLKLRSHESDNVRNAVERLALSLLDECHASLADCTVFLVETAIFTWKEEDDSTDLSGGPKHTASSIRDSALPESVAVQTTLQDLAMIYPELQDAIKTVVHNMITSMPRIMQTSDEKIKQQCIFALSRGQRIVKVLNIDSSLLHEALSSALRDSIVALTSSKKQLNVVADAEFEGEMSVNPTDLVTRPGETRTFKPIMLAHGSQAGTRDAFLRLVSGIGSPSQQADLATDMISLARDLSGIDQVTALWLAFELLKVALAKNEQDEQFFDFSGTMSTNEPTEVFQELYQLSVLMLTSHTDSLEVDWRLEAIAIEVTTFAASQMGVSFRPELIDTLYPIATYLGSQNTQLRLHAMTALGLIASACGYQDVSELIVDNADYMVNSVSLRLTSMDVTPASLQVLRMMVRLTGPKLLPFLDDTVAAIFAALDNYHGYPAFVERLFSVLSEVVQQGVKSDVLLLESKESKSLDHRKRSMAAATINDIESEVKERIAKKQKRRKEKEDLLPGVRAKHPQKPWTSEAKQLLDERERKMKADDEEKAEDTGSGGEVEKPKPVRTPTYELLSRVTTLTQYYLTSPTPTLRKSLLDLLSTITPSMALDEDAFLPMVNSLWPVVISRLRDGEPFVVAAACRAIAALAQGSGDFLASRIKTEWWDSMSRWCQKAKQNAKTGATGNGGRSGKSNNSVPIHSGRNIGRLNMALVGNEVVLPHRPQGSSRPGSGGVDTEKYSDGGLGRFAQASQVWEATVDMLVALVSFVRLDDEVFDQILELLADELESNSVARKALEVVNADAVWLARFERGSLTQDLSVPVMDGIRFAALA